MKRALTLLVVASLGVGCSNSSQSPTTPSTTSSSTSAASGSAYYFTGTLAPQNSSFYSFTTAQAGTVSVTLASLSVGPFNPTPGTSVGLGFGTPAGTGCSLTRSLKTGAGLAAQLVTAVAMGVFCVDIFDVGNLTVPTDFVVRIVHP